MSQHLQEFTNSMAKLEDINRLVQTSVSQKQAFSNNLVGKLKDINGKIQVLAGQINQLKATLDGLQGKVTTNGSAINEKNTQIGQLNQTIIQLNAEKQQMSEQLHAIQEQTITEKAALQQKIDVDEAKIRTLMESQTALQTQANALTDELANKGDVQALHSREIQQETQKFQEQLEAQSQVNIQKMNELTNEITVRDNKLNDLQQQLQEKTNEVTAHAQNINTIQGQTASQIEALNQQIVDLRTENEDLIQRIIAATRAINMATASLETLSNSSPNPQEIEQLFGMIEQSIKDISNSLQSGTNNKVQINPNQIIEIRDSGTSNPSQLTYNTLITELTRKASESGNVEKYKNAKIQILNATSPEAIPTILSNSNIQYKNGKIMGGKRPIYKRTQRTKKNKRIKLQKGGYTYKGNTKRRRISTGSF
jgi:chromosome segregation ATPase